jgi:signal peptidase I
VRRLVAVLVTAAALVAVIGGITLVEDYRIVSSSMAPALEDGDRVAVIRFEGPIEPDRGDLVAYTRTARAADRCGSPGVSVHRIIGLPGETVVERRGRVVLEGRPLREPYVARGRRGALSGRWDVEPGGYFLLGDNRIESCDSRVFGAIREDNLIGEVFATYWPPGRFTFR